MLVVSFDFSMDKITEIRNEIHNSGDIRENLFHKSAWESRYKRVNCENVKSEIHRKSA